MHVGLLLIQVVVGLLIAARPWLPRLSAVCSPRSIRLQVACGLGPVSPSQSSGHPCPV